MLVVIGFTALAGVALLVAVLVAAPAGGRTRLRDTDRRLRYVRRHPLDVNSGDIERLLARHGLADDDVRLVTEKSAAAGIAPYTLWLWLEMFGARTLAVLVVADVGNAELLDRLGSSAVADLPELEVLAALNGLSLVRSAVPSAHDAAPAARPAVDSPSSRRARRNGVAA